MNLSTQQRETVRLCILRYCLSPAGVGVICSNLRAEGFTRIQRDQAEQEILYLADKQLLAATDKFISPENKIWRTTADGRDYLAEQNQE